MASNFEFMSPQWRDIADLGVNAEASSINAPNDCVRSLKKIGARIADELLAVNGLTLPEDTSQSDKISFLRSHQLIIITIEDILLSLENTSTESDISVEEAEQLLRMTHKLCHWFVMVYGYNDNTLEESCKSGIKADSVPKAEETMSADTGMIEAEETETSETAESTEVSEPQLEETFSSEENQHVDVTEQHTEEADSAEIAKSVEDSENDQGHSENVDDADSNGKVEEALDSGVHIEAQVLGVVNYALLQNGMRIIRSLRISNDSDSDITNAELQISSEPAFCLTQTEHIDLIPAHHTFTLDSVKLSLDGNYLAGITERISGILSIAVISDGKIISKEQTEIAALAFDQWHGTSIYPELLCAFITPNHPVIATITARAAELLGKWTGDPSLDAYQSNDSNRVLKQAAAVYAALQEQNIVYCVHPSSFESVGQRIRLCDAVMEQKLGTCMDLTLLYASALEAIGLHSLLILLKGHIFAGLWLEDMSFPETVQDDASLITKRLAQGINEIAVVECTAFVANENTVSFDDAQKLAEKSLSDRGAVECFIDVNRARLSGVKPIPMRISTENGWRVERPVVDEGNLTAAPKDRDDIVLTDEEDDTPVSRKTRWERKLLDLGLRNSLINLRMSKTLIPILASSVDDLEDSLADGEDFKIMPRMSDRYQGELSFDTMHELGEYASLIQLEFKNHRLRCALSETELAKTIKELYRSAKSALEENGANTLYMALGLLRWYENPRSTKPRYAPLILIPVEIVRKSAAQGYVVRLRDDEPQMNVTILEKLKQDFQIDIKGLNVLPEDDHGIDTRKVFTIIRKAVMDQKNWDVLESAYIGIFSFSQFVMWNDIRSRYDDLAKNKIVSSLMEGKLEWDAEEMSIGDEVDEDGVFLPMSADASQLFAIKAASEGKSFVLHGPPGTGKSQTITALIANALAQGKTVLFVAEKMAALEVVERRLDKIGIGDFCLELHSNKAKKKSVLEQLRKASEVTKGQTAQSYENKASQISRIRAELNEYVRELHKVRNCGKTLYELINEYEANKSFPDIPAIEYDAMAVIDREMAEEQSVMLQRVIAAAKAVGHPKDHPLSAVRTSNYNQQLRLTFPESIAAYKSALEDFRDAVYRFYSEVNLPADSFAEITTADAIALEMKFWLFVPKSWAKNDNIGFLLTQLQEMSMHFSKAKQHAALLSQSWNQDFLNQDGRLFLEEYRAVSVKWLIPRVLGLNSLCKKLAPFAIGTIAKDKLEQQLITLMNYRIEMDAAQALFACYGESLGNMYCGAATDWENISSICSQARDSAARLVELTGSDEFRMQYCGRNEIHDEIDGLINALPPVLSAKSSLDEIIDTSYETGDGWISTQLSVCENVTAHFDELKEWITWNSIAKDASDCGLACIVKAYEQGIEHDEISGCFKKLVSKTLAMQLIDSVPVLNGFSGAVFNEKIEQFRQMDKELTDLTQKEIYCRLAAKVPNFAKEAAQSSELGILQRAIRSGGRGMSIRKLFDQIPNMLPRLCPCMLMSPISAAQYLAPNREPFDLVVFDEASQITTSKAVGALARGKNAVIVGDPKQMPPTSFFATNSVDEDNLEDEDLESILDDCLALNLPQTHLLWHYRSRHESLIAFSNSHFYENKLYTFPSVNDREAKVKLVHTDGFFDRGKTRQNRSEAEAIISELKRRCHDKNDAGLSVGVVTFNINQQNLIDDLLIEACKEDNELENWAYNCKEPLFIKNLENVQGDERDVILFSIGYGPDKDGHVSMNFGPLNRDGGWRRLNVAVSRARCEMTVFSTLSPDQIDLNRTHAEGVAALKAFLEYASGKELSSEGPNRQSVRGDLEGVSKAICAALAEVGYETERNVGHSQYRIDIGVIDPDNPGRYLLGILLDGNTYRTSKTVRDRELAQISVLESLGWAIARVWTMDWWDNSRKELSRLIDLLKNAAEESSAVLEQEIIDEDENETVQAVEAPETEETPGNTEQESKPDSEKSEDPIVSVSTEIIPAAPSERTSENVISYRAAELKSIPLSTDDFVQPACKKILKDAIKAVIEAEAPISEARLERRVIQSFGITRTSSKIQNYLSELISSLDLQSTIQYEDRFIWTKDQSPEEYNLIRVNGEGDCKRDVKEIPLQEAANAVCLVLHEQISMSHDDLIKESAKLMNFTRMGSNVSASFEAAVQYVDAKGLLAADDNGNYRLSESGNEYALIFD